MFQHLVIPDNQSSVQLQGEEKVQQTDFPASSLPSCPIHLPKKQLQDSQNISLRTNKKKVNDNIKKDFLSKL